MISLIIKLTLAHLIGDFLLQPQSWVNSKEEKGLKSWYFWCHIGIHVITLSLILFTTSLLIEEKIKILLIIIVSHGIIDILKIWIGRRKRTPKTLFFLDQILHLLAIAVATYTVFPFNINTQWLNQDIIYLALSAIITVTFGLAVIIKVILLNWKPSKKIDNENSSDSVNAPAGFWIGILERLLIFYFVISGLWTGIGFLLTAKSVLRFGTLSNEKEKDLVEYILVGTLLSFTLAIGCALLFKHVASIL